MTTDTLALREQLFMQIQPGETLQSNQARAILNALVSPDTRGERG